MELMLSAFSRSLDETACLSCAIRYISEQSFQGGSPLTPGVLGAGAPKKVMQAGIEDVGQFDWFDHMSR